MPRKWILEVPPAYLPLAWDFSLLISHEFSKREAYNLEGHLILILHNKCSLSTNKFTFECSGSALEVLNYLYRKENCSQYVLCPLMPGVVL